MFFPKFNQQIVAFEMKKLFFFKLFFFNFFKNVGPLPLYAAGPPGPGGSGGLSYATDCRCRAL